MRSSILADVVKSRNVRCIAECNRKLKGTLEECVRFSTYWLYEKLVLLASMPSMLIVKRLEMLLLGLMNLLHLQGVLSNLGV
jgi:hypothetical protein